MKRLLVLILVLTLLVVTGTFVSADGQTILKVSNFDKLDRITEAK